jgi:hypothetical protein
MRRCGPYCPIAHLADVIQGVDFVNGIKPSNQDQAAA